VDSQARASDERMSNAKKRRRICFIDDEDDELVRAEKVLSRRFDIGTGSDLDTAVSKVRKPKLFLLDMYYGPKTRSSDRAAVAKAWRDLRQAQSTFYDLLQSVGQSAKGGRELAEHVRARYPGIPIVFFTRKGSLEDAVEALRQGAVAVLKKPDPAASAQVTESNGKALDDALADHEDELVRSLSQIMDRYSSWWGRHARLRGLLEGVAASLVAGLLMLLLRSG
jgi:CheY-like chemotaxis protein